MNRLPVYPAWHPAAIAMRSMVRALRDGSDLFDALRSVAEVAGVGLGSGCFDDAATLVGMPYSRKWDLYLDRAALREMDRAYDARPRVPRRPYQRSSFS